MAKKTTKKLPPFEESVDRLEALIETMESEQLPLQTLLDHYEEGHELLTHCQTLLDDAERRIEVVTLASQNTTKSTGTENKLASEPAASDNRPSDAASDDIRLL
ncbi:exodeoxyribonuclease VII small subunit [Roseibacillus ishigakijimensis]|uniref:Exodeoxyribonuclease 7 small subunit n=1 Tax=Roseibacillus ishigakijimensis TaxID=454146 RepID=A0A934VP07_9BACT|nr:exodeoxyribonuclease VII small subunit [Roseibacillus ishigakijimensis]MBK1835595.1 exodeoxyribonuclease VII small subunit [Roseibacillus ishigakijimensis]